MEDLLEVGEDRQAKKLRPDQVAHYHAWLETAQYYNHALNLTQAFEYVEDTLHVPIDGLRALLRKARRTSKFFLRPADILELIEKEEEEDHNHLPGEDRELCRRGLRMCVEDPKLEIRDVIKKLKEEKKRLSFGEERGNYSFTKNNLLTA